MPIQTWETKIIWKITKIWDSYFQIILVTFVAQLRIGIIFDDIKIVSFWKKVNKRLCSPAFIFLFNWNIILDFSKQNAYIYIYCF